MIQGWAVSRTTDIYRKFIQESRAEFGVGKHCYVASKCGWFSDRTVCYLASGRPALLQNTGLDDWLPVGSGLVTFDDLDAAVRGVAAIDVDYENHCLAARRLAEEYFATDKVLPNLLASAMQ